MPTYRIPVGQIFKTPLFAHQFPVHDHREVDGQYNIIVYGKTQHNTY